MMRSAWGNMERWEEDRARTLHAYTIRATAKLGFTRAPMENAKCGLTTLQSAFKSIVDMATADGKKTGGRRAGVENKFNGELRFKLRETLQSENFDPIAELIRVNREAWKEYDRYSDIYDKICDKRAHMQMIPLTTNDAPTYLKIAADAAKDILPYLLPKLKHVEMTGENGKDLFSSFTDLMKNLAEK